MRTFIRSLIAILALGFMGWTATPAQAQTANPFSEKPANWVQHFEEQVADLLRAPNTDRQEGAMQLVIHYAQFETASGQPVFDFEGSVPRLLELYKHSPNQGQRLMALSALSAIGTPYALQELAATIHAERSDVLRRRALHVLSAHLHQ